MGGTGSQSRPFCVLVHQVMHGLWVYLLSNEHPRLMQRAKDLSGGGEVRADPPCLNCYFCPGGMGIERKCGGLPVRLRWAGIVVVLNVVKGEGATSNAQSCKRLNGCTG
jgi:hypothetical protein